VVGTAILCHDAYEENLAALYRLLKPGGQLLFFEANYWNPQVFLKTVIRPLGRWTGDAECQIGMSKFQLMKTASHQDFTHIEAVHAEPRVKLVRRTPPNGVGRALRDGYAAATGRYVLTMDSDFVLLVPELRDLFECVAAGHDGAIGSRFSYESVLINYPFFKILCNRAFHWLVKLALLPGVRDVANNLKMVRADSLKTLETEEAPCAASRA